ncbi:MAG: hypothetical protein B7Z30_08640 [Rhizobiales bacterium 12-68-15]|nr:MAG: hypothetical protein B7Z30_08640 [Rhizobiales bacterium 12-68-15]
MPWPITNQQADPMSFTLAGGAVVPCAGGATVAVAADVTRVEYHRLTYTRVGLWPFPANQALNASYPQGQNIHIQNPVTGVTCVFQYP